MFNLVKADLFRSLRDRSLKVGLIIFAIFSLIMFLIYKVFVDEMLADILKEIPNVDTTMFTKILVSSIFQLSGDYGFVLPIILVTFMVKDFTFGTIRNKINSGYTKVQVFLSTLISSLIIGLTIITFMWIINLLFGFIMFGYTDFFTAKELKYVFGQYFFGVLIYANLISFVTLLLMQFRTVSVPITLTIATPLLLAIAFELLFQIDKFSFLDKVYMCTCYGASSQLVTTDFIIINSSYLLSGTNATIIIISSILWIAVLAVGGAYLNKKRDIK